MTAATRLAEFIVKTPLDECPAAAVTLVCRATLDTLGVMLAGAAEPAARAVRRVMRAEGGLPLATVVGTRWRTSPSRAALANGVAGHAHDFDDTNFALMGHPSVPLLATLLAAGEAEMADGRALVGGYVVGFEVGAALGRALNPDHYTRGWHATSSIGTLACAAAAARVIGLSLSETRHALGIAASLASGLKANFGSMTKPYHAGHAAMHGTLAAALAREGLDASDSALDGRQGYVAAFGGAGSLSESLATLGARWEILESGIAVKPYPSCALTHAAIDALLDLRARHALEPGRITDVEIGVNRVVPDVLVYHAPATPLERKFSMEFCAAAALANGGVDLDSFEDAGAAAPALGALASRVRVIVDPALPDGLEQHAWSRVTVRLTDGTSLASPPRGAQGHPATPLSPERLRAKFLACATRAIAREDAEGLAEQIAELEHVPDIRVLTARLVGDVE